MGNSPIHIAYPAGISPDIAAKLSAAANGADSTAGSVNNGVGTLTSVVSDVSVMVNDIYTSSQGQSVQAMAGFWDGAGSIGQGGLGTGGVISDASKALNFLNSFSGCMPGVSGNINDQLSAISSGISAISTVQANPGKNWTPAEASGLEQQIGNMVAALEAINSALLSTASSVTEAAGAVKLGAVCASGVSIGQKGGGIPLTQPPSGGSRKYQGRHRRPAGGGGGAKPPGGSPPTTGGGGEPPGGKPGPFGRFGNFLKKNAPIALAVGTFNTGPYIVNDLLNHKDPLADPGFYAVYGANLATGLLAAPLLTGSRGIVGAASSRWTWVGPVTDGKVAIIQSFFGGVLIGPAATVMTRQVLDHILSQPSTPQPTVIHVGQTTFTSSQTGPDQYTLTIAQTGKADVTQTNLTLAQVEQKIANAAQVASSPPPSPAPTTSPTPK